MMAASVVVSALLLLFVTFQNAIALLTCPAGWSPYNQQCFKAYVGKPLSRDNAQTFCQGVKGSLAEIPDLETQTFLWNTFNSKLQLKDAWIYYHDRNKTNIFIGKNDKEISFTNWGFGRPRSHGRLDCVLLWTSWEGKWTDEDCDQQYNFVCQRPMALADIDCPSGWSLSIDGKTCLKQAHNQTSWVNAGNVCRAVGGTKPAEIDYPELNDYIADHLTGNVDYWIGLKRAPGGSPRWNNGRLALYLNVEDKKKWSSSGSQCGYMRKSQSKWKAGDCVNDRKNVLCEGQAKATIGCKEGYFLLREKKTCVKIHLELNSWQDARQKCSVSDRGSDLVTITDAETRKLLSDVILTYNGVSNTTSYWIGLHSPNDDVRFKWLNSLAKTNYTYWGSGQPNSTKGKESCVYIEGWSNDQPWLNEDCSAKKPFICQHSAFLDKPTNPKIGYECGDKDWSYFDGVCYRIEHSMRATWFEARKHCASYGADLVIANNSRINDFLADHIAIRATGNLYWIGLDGLYDGDGRWVDGSPFLPNVFNGFGKGMQNDKGGWEKCVNTRADGKWSDNFCGDRYAFICSKKYGSNSTHSLAPYYPEGGCPPGYYSTPSSSWCFQLKGVEEDERKSFDNALEDCRVTNFPMSRLASIHSSADQNLVTSLMASINTSVWIGLRQKFQDEEYEWVDNTRLRYSNWGHNQPLPVHLNDPKLKLCVSMMTSSNIPGHWANIACDVKLPFICEAPKDKKLNVTTSDVTCSSGYRRLRDFCYKIHNDSKTWSESKATCTKEGGELVEILDGFDAAFVNVLADTVNAKDVWIGLSKDASGEFKWQDGHPVDFSLWTPGKSASALKCGLQVVNDRWIAADCQEKHPFVCQVKNVIPVSTTPAPGPTRTWVRYGKIYYYYAEVEHRKTWPEAAYACTQINGHLVTFGSFGATGIFYPDRFLPRMVIWTGMQRKYAYVWSNQRKTLVTWAYGSNNVSKADKELYQECVAVNTAGDGLVYSDCFVKRPYVCEIIKDPLPTTPVTPTPQSTALLRSKLQRITTTMYRRQNRAGIQATLCHTTLNYPNVTAGQCCKITYYSECMKRAKTFVGSMSTFDAMDWKLLETTSLSIMDSECGDRSTISSTCFTDPRSHSCSEVKRQKACGTNVTVPTTSARATCLKGIYLNDIAIGMSQLQCQSQPSTDKYGLLRRELYGAIARFPLHTKQRLWMDYCFKMSFSSATTTCEKINRFGLCKNNVKDNAKKYSIFDSVQWKEIDNYQIKLKKELNCGFV